jgi:hypothetical protein
LEKHVGFSHERLIRVSLILLFLSILISVGAITQTVKAQDPTIKLNPVGGGVGRSVEVTADGFGLGQMRKGHNVLIVYFGTIGEVTRMHTTAPGTYTASFNVPDVPRGGYTVKATEWIFDPQTGSWTIEGNSASAKFTVITSGTSTSPPSSEGEESTWWDPGGTPIVASEGDLGPLTIGLIAVALVAIFVPATALYLRGSKRNRVYDDERPESPYYKPETPSAPNRYQATTRSYQPSYRSQQLTRPTVTPKYRQQPSYGYYSQPSRPYSTTRRPYSTTSYAQPSSYSRPTPHTMICHNCHKAVSDDYNICPHCHKRLR